MSSPTPQTNWSFAVNRQTTVPLTDQIHGSLRSAIVEGHLEPGARLPSGRDLAVQLGVARGTVRAAYERLADEDLIFGAGAAGSRVTKRLAVPEVPLTQPTQFARPLRDFINQFSAKPLPFQMGVPAQDAFPAKVWAKMRTRAVRDDALGHLSYADPRGEPELRAQIASHLAVSRRLHCVPDQILITSGYRHGLSLALQALEVRGQTAWMEEPGYPIARRALELAGMTVIPVPVDAEGIVVNAGISRAPNARLALVTPGQQAPLGATLSPVRRSELLDWAAGANGWILEDDYLSELQLDGRASPALAGGSGAQRVIHVGSFSKTMSPSLGLGFLVAPPGLVDRIVEVAAILAPAPNRTTQLALAGFLADGHYLRHLRQMKAIYAERRAALTSDLLSFGLTATAAGLALILDLPQGTDDVTIARAALRLGLHPAPLSPWFAKPEQASKGLLLSVTNLKVGSTAKACGDLRDLLTGSIAAGS